MHQVYLPSVPTLGLSTPFAALAPFLEYTPSSWFAIIALFRSPAPRLCVQRFFRYPSDMHGFLDHRVGHILRFGYSEYDIQYIG